MVSTSQGCRKQEGPDAREVLSGVAERSLHPHTPARAGGCHSPFPVPHLGHQLLVTPAQGWLLVRAYQAAALQEELGQRRAGHGQ